MGFTLAHCKALDFFFFFFKQEELREIHAKHYTAGHTGYYEKAPLASEPQHRTPHLSQNPFHTT